MTGSQGSLWVKGGDLHGRRNGGKEEVLYLDVEDLEVKITKKKQVQQAY